MHNTKRQTYQKKTWSDPFINILPSIDLHGYSRDLIYTPVNDFINDNLKLGKKKIVVVHGIGEGILKEELRLLLKMIKGLKRCIHQHLILGAQLLNYFKRYAKILTNWRQKYVC